MSKVKILSVEITQLSFCAKCEQVIESKETQTVCKCGEKMENAGWFETKPEKGL